MSKESIIISCINCGTKNRVPKARLNDKPVCGHCRKPLPVKILFDHPVDITDNTFENEVLSFPGPVLVDCWAPWCAPCRMVSPILDELASEYAGKIKITKLNIDENQITASSQKIQSIPTMLLFKKGKLINRFVGALPKAEIKKHLLSVVDAWN